MNKWESVKLIKFCARLDFENLNNLYKLWKLQFLSRLSHLDNVVVTWVFFSCAAVKGVSWCFVHVYCLCVTCFLVVLSPVLCLNIVTVYVYWNGRSNLYIYIVSGKKLDQQYIIFDIFKFIAVILASNNVILMPNYQYNYCPPHLISADSLPCKM